jgi:hypothetical protein
MVTVLENEHGKIKVMLDQTPLEFKRFIVNPSEMLWLLARILKLDPVNLLQIILGELMEKRSMENLFMYLIRTF